MKIDSLFYLCFILIVLSTAVAG